MRFSKSIIKLNLPFDVNKTKDLCVTHPVYELVGIWDMEHETEMSTEMRKALQWQVFYSALGAISFLQRGALGLTQGFVTSFPESSIGCWAKPHLLSSQAKNKLPKELLKRNTQNLSVRPSAPLCTPLTMRKTLRTIPGLLGRSGKIRPGRGQQTGCSGGRPHRGGQGMVARCLLPDF